MDRAEAVENEAAALARRVAEIRRDAARARLRAARGETEETVAFVRELGFEELLDDDR